MAFDINKTIEENERNSAYDLIRIFACFMVIVNHTLGIVDLYGSIPFYKWIISLSMFAICKTAVTLFVFLTGILLLRKEESYKKWAKRVLRIIFLIYIWDVLYGEFWNLYFNKQFDFTIIYKCLLTFFSKEGSWHLWYLYTLVGLYIMIPFLRKIYKSMNNSDWKIYLSIWFLFDMIIPLHNIINSNTQILFHQNYSIPLFLDFMALLFVGCFIDHLTYRRSYIILAGIIFITSICLNVLVCKYYTQINGTYSRIFDDARSCPVVLTAISIFYFIKSFCRKHKIYGDKIIEEIANSTLGIYLIHPIFLNILYTTKIYINFIEKYNTSLIFILFLQIFTFIICSIIIIILKKIPIVKYII